MTQAAPSLLATSLPWDLVALDYALELTPHLERYAREAIRLVGPIHGARVLDVACGPGTLTMLAAPQAARVTALDFSEGMMTGLRARLAEAKIENVDARHGDGQSLELADASFDAAFSMFGLFMFPDRGRGLRELHRVLVPGGRVAISSWLPLGEVPAMAAMFAVLREARPDLPVPDPKPPLGTAEEMCGELEAAGFRDAVAPRVAFSLDYADPAALGASLGRTMPPLVLLRRKLGDAFRPIGEAVAARLLEALGPGPGKMTMPAWIGVATA